MDEYPDENEEFELMYGDELELIREREGKNYICELQSITSYFQNLIIQPQTQENH